MCGFVELLTSASEMGIPTSQVIGVHLPNLLSTGMISSFIVEYFDKPSYMTPI